MTRTTREPPLFEPETNDMRYKRYKKMLLEYCASPYFITISEYAKLVGCKNQEAGQRMKGCRHQCDGRNKSFLIEDVAGQLAKREKV